MNNNYQRIVYFVATLIFLLSVEISIATAESIMPYADEVFDSASISLTTNKNADFQALTATTCSEIKVTAVVLQKRNSSGIWVNSKILTPPSDVWRNGEVYDATKDYSSVIGTGTFRLKATFSADDHSITRYSNVRTYS